MIKIPITNQPNQSFTVTIPKDTSNIVLDFYVYWNPMSEYWMMNVGNAETKVELITALPIITGDYPRENLIEQYGYLGIGSAYVVPLSPDIHDYPGLDDWDTNFIMTWDANG